MNASLQGPSILSPWAQTRQQLLSWLHTKDREWSVCTRQVDTEVHVGRPGIKKQAEEAAQPKLRTFREVESGAWKEKEKDGKSDEGKTCKQTCEIDSCF